MSTASAQNEARAAIAMLAALGNKVVSFRGGAGEVTTTGFLDRDGADFGLSVVMDDPRWVATLLVEDVGEVHRGDTVTDEDGNDWVLMEQIPSSDDYVVDWVAESNG